MNESKTINKNLITPYFIIFIKVILLIEIWEKIIEQRPTSRIQEKCVHRLTCTFTSALISEMFLFWTYSVISIRKHNINEY